MFPMIFLPLADFKTVTAPSPAEDPAPVPLDLTVLAAETGMFVAMVVALLAVTYLVLWLWSRAGKTQPPDVSGRHWILIDGSNVMHWQDNTPKLAPLARVVEQLRALGYAPGVVFDANAGWKLFGRYMDDDELARLLKLPREQVLVVPKGQPADPFLLATARDLKARIVTNDRYRDWVEAHPEVLQPGFLIRGGSGDGNVWLKGVEAVRAEPS